MTHNIKRHWLFISLSLLLSLAAFFYIFSYGYKQWDGLTNALGKIPSRLIVVALGLSILGHLWNSAIWLITLRQLGSSLGWSEAYRAWSCSRLMRYLPGKIAPYVSRIALHQGGSRLGAGFASIIEIVGALLAFACMGWFAIFFYEFLPTNIIWISLLLALVLLLLLPYKLAFFEALLLRFGVSSSNTANASYVKLTVIIAALNIPLMLIHGMAFYLILNDLLGIGITWYLLIVVTYYAASYAGQLAILVPAGIGVREAALLGMMAGLVSEQALLLIAVLLIRFVQVCSEVVNAAISAAVYKCAHNHT